MSQFRSGTVRVENSNANVRHIYELSYSSGSGTFTANENVAWPSSTGKFVRDDTTGDILYIYRVSGNAPAPGDTITGSTSGATRVISALAETSPPDFNTNISQGEIFLVEAKGVPYYVSSSIYADYFVLSSDYQEVTQNEASYAVVKDFTSFFSYPYPNVGDIDAPTVVKRALNDIDTAMKLADYFQQAISSWGGAATIAWASGLSAAITLDEDVTFTFTAPLGPCLLKLKLTQDGTGEHAVTWPGTVKWLSDATPTINLSPGGQDLILFYYDGTDYHGVRFGGLTGGRNHLGNGGHEVWQRHSSYVFISGGSNAYTSDRWSCEAKASSNTTVSKQAGLTDQSQSCARVQRGASQTGAGDYFGQPFELEEIIRLRGKKVTVSLTARKGANYSAASDILKVHLYVGTGAAGRRGSTGYTSETAPISAQEATLTGSAQQFSFTSTVVIPTNATQLCVQFETVRTGTAGANDWYEIDDTQLEIGLFATDFDRRSYRQDLNDCLPYTWQIDEGTANRDQALGMVVDADSASFLFRHPLIMRKAPTVTFSAGTFDMVEGGTARTISSMEASDATPEASRAQMASSSMTAANAIVLRGKGGSGYIRFDAEL